MPPPLEIEGAWEVRFPPDWGGPDRITFNQLVSWSKHPAPGVKYFSGTATYRKTIRVPAGMICNGRRLLLDLGRVEVCAKVKLGGRNLGVLWKPPMRIDITDAVRPGENDLQVDVANLGRTE